MKLLLDEMHAPVVASTLLAEGRDVIAVAATPSLRGLPDGEVLAHAAAAERSLVTENVVDFVLLANQWAAEGRPHAGLVFTSPKRFNRANLAYPGDLIAALRAFLIAPPDLGPSAVWWL